MAARTPTPGRSPRDAPVFREDADRGWVVGTIRQVQGLHLWHQAEEAAPDPLLGLRHPADSDTEPHLGSVSQSGPQPTGQPRMARPAPGPRGSRSAESRPSLPRVSRRRDLQVSPFLG